MSFHSMRELVIWHGERGLFWQLGTALAVHEGRAEAGALEREAKEKDRNAQAEKRVQTARNESRTNAEFPTHANPGQVRAPSGATPDLISNERLSNNEFPDRD
jgi:hypothetical protein